MSHTRIQQLGLKDQKDQCNEKLPCPPRAYPIKYAPLRIIIEKSNFKPFYLKESPTPSQVMQPTENTTYVDTLLKAKTHPFWNEIAINPYTIYFDGTSANSDSGKHCTPISS